MSLWKNPTSRPKADKTWTVHLEEQTVTHEPTGLIIRFTPARDGSGAMQADAVNPDVLPSAKNRETLETLKALPGQAWQAYAEAAEAAFKKLH